MPYLNQYDNSMKQVGISITILPLKKLRLREVMSFEPHSLYWQSWDLNPIKNNAKDHTLNQLPFICDHEML